MQEKRRPKQGLITLCNSPKSECIQVRVTLSSQAASDRTKVKLSQVVPVEGEDGHQEEFIHGKSCQAMEQAVQGGAEVAREMTQGCGTLCCDLVVKVAISHR